MTALGPVREFAAVTTRGLCRHDNQDALAAAGLLLTGEVTDPVSGTLSYSRVAAFVVSDGVGSQVHGSRASREVASGFLADMEQPTFSDGCFEAVLRANLRLHEVMLLQPETTGMAATVAGIVLVDASVCWFNVGDSRVYRMNRKGLAQLSVDDTSAAPNGRSHTLKRSLGGQRAIAPIQPHLGESAVVDGDRFLLCSDGLSDMLSDTTIAEILERQPQSAAAARALLETALGAGGRDNIAILVVQ